MQNNENADTAPALVITRNADGTLGDAEPLEDVSLRVYSGDEFLGEITFLTEVFGGKKIEGGKEFDLLELVNRASGGVREAEPQFQRQCFIKKTGPGTAVCEHGMRCPDIPGNDCKLGIVEALDKIIIWCNCISDPPDDGIDFLTMQRRFPAV